MLRTTRRWCMVVWALALFGCATGPSNVVIHSSPYLTVWLTVDPRAGSGHSHPFIMTPEAVTTVLNGVHIEDRDTITGMGFFGSRNGNPAFTQAEMATLSLYLAEALKKASPKDMATFYMVVGDANHRRSITSGGLFIEANRRLHLMLANCRSVPTGGQDYTSAMEVDTRDEPLLPVSPHRFAVRFQPVDAGVKSSKSNDVPSFPAYGSVYEDPAKSIIIDLDRLFEHRDTPSSP